MPKTIVALAVFMLITLLSGYIAQAKKPKSKSGGCELNGKFLYKNDNGRYLCQNVCPLVDKKASPHNRRSTWSCKSAYAVANKLVFQHHIFTHKKEYHSYNDDGGNAWYCPLKRNCAMKDMSHTDELCVDYTKCSQSTPGQPTKKQPKGRG